MVQMAGRGIRKHHHQKLTNSKTLYIYVVSTAPMIIANLRMHACSFLAISKLAIFLFRIIAGSYYELNFTSYI